MWLQLWLQPSYTEIASFTKMTVQTTGYFKERILETVIDELFKVYIMLIEFKI